MVQEIGLAGSQGVSDWSGQSGRGGGGGGGQGPAMPLLQAHPCANEVFDLKTLGLWHS